MQHKKKVDGDESVEKRDIQTKAKCIEAHRWTSNRIRIWNKKNVSRHWLSFLCPLLLYPDDTGLLTVPNETIYLHVCHVCSYTKQPIIIVRCLWKCICHSTIRFVTWTEINKTGIC